jgi:hypothetical protein
VTGKDSCVGLTAQDELNAFEWICIDTSVPVRMISIGLKADKNLSSLIDFSSSAWKENRVIVSDNNTVYGQSPWSLWWGNPVIVDNDGSNGLDMNEGDIRIITANAAARYVFGQNKVALVVDPTITLTGSTAFLEQLVTAENLRYLWFEGRLDVTNDYIGVAWISVNFSVLRNVAASNATHGVFLTLSTNNSLAKIYTSNTSGGLTFSTEADNNTISDVSLSNSYDGLYLNDGASNNRFSQVVTANNVNGVNLSNATDNTFTNVTSSYNDTGIYINFISNNNNLSFITTNNNKIGFYIGASSNLISQVASSGNDDGFSFYNGANNIISNIIASDNNNYGISTSTVANNKYSDLIKVGNNLAGDCFVLVDAVNGGVDPGLDDDSAVGLNDGIHEGLCLQQGSSNFGTATTGVSLTASFTSAWALRSSDTVARELFSLPTGNDILTHTWSDSSTTTFLRHAVEIMGDGIGNDNGLCESNETCLFTPNIGTYQGHGPLTDAGAFTDGSLTGITLLRFETNGYP